jgi:hypothetical protein
MIIKHKIEINAIPPRYVIWRPSGCLTMGYLTEWEVGSFKHCYMGYMVTWVTWLHGLDGSMSCMVTWVGWFHELHGYVSCMVK